MFAMEHYHWSFRARKRVGVGRRGAVVPGMLTALLGATVLILGYQLHVLKLQADDLRRWKALPYVGQLMPVVRADRVRVMGANRCS